MENFLKIIAYLSLLVVTNAKANNYTYFGMDLLYSYSNFKQDYGKEIFNNDNERQYNGFIGHYFSNLLGFEAGYAKNVTKHSLSVVPAGTSEFGIPDFTAIASNVYDTTQSAYQYNFNYVPKLQLTQNLSIIGVFGVAYIKTKDYLNLTMFDNSEATYDEQNNYDITFNANKAIPRCGFRLQYMLAKWLGLRASYIWEKTELLQPTATRNINPTQTLQAKFNNSSVVGIGVFVKF